MFYITVILIILISFLYWLEKKELRGFFLFWYIIFLPTSSLLPEDIIKIPGFRFEVLFGLFFFMFDLFASRENSIETKIIWKSIKPALMLYLLQMIYILYEAFKTTIVPVASVSEGMDINFPIFLIRNLIFLAIFLRICFLLQDDYFRKIVLYALTAGFILLGISSFFSEIFISIGLNPAGKYAFDAITGHKVFRSAGLYRGDPTQFSAFLSTGFGLAFALFLLAKTNIFRIYLFLAIIACFLGNLNSGTRAGFIGIISVIIFYLLVEKQSFSRKSLIIFLIIISGIWMVFNFGEFFLSRLESTGEQLSGADNQMSRMAVWSAHVLYFINNPDIWLFGTWEPVHVGQFILASHSTPLKYLVYAGIPFFLIYYKNIFSLFSIYFKNREKFSFNFIYPLLGYFVPSAMNDNFDLAYLPIIIALGLFNPRMLKISALFYDDYLMKKKDSKKNFEKEIERKTIL